MVLLDNADENVFERHQELCVNLNMDKDAAEEAWRNYETIRQNYTLEVSVSSTSNVADSIIL